MPRKRRPPVDVNSAFLNVPYDSRFNDLYLAYIAGVTAFGLVPRATVEIPGGERRLDRILSLIKICRYSFHDLSRVEVDGKPPRTPRFNMPFELGLAVAWSKLPDAADNTWFVFEAMSRRIQKSLSDLNGTDVYVHDGTVNGVLRELGNALLRREHQPTMPQLQAIYFDLKKTCGKLKRDRGTNSLYDPGVFKDLVIVAREYAAIRIPALGN